MRNPTISNGPQPTSHVVTRSRDVSVDKGRRTSSRPNFYRFRSADNAQIDALSSSDIDDNNDGEAAQAIIRSTLDNALNNTYNNIQDNLYTQSSPVRPRRRTVVAVVGTAAAALATAESDPKASLSPFGDSHNRRSGSLRRARTSTGGAEKSRKRRSIEKTPVPELEGLKPLAAIIPKTSQRPKPRVSAPSRIPAPIRATLPTPAPVRPALPLTPERSPPVEGELVRSGEDSLEKLSIGSSPRKAFDHSPTFSPPSGSPTRKLKMMDVPFHRRESSDLLEAFFLDSPEQPKFQALPPEFQPTSRVALTFQRQVSHAHVLFGGPAIQSPTPAELPPSSSQTNTPGDEDDDEFFTRPSPVKPTPQFVEPSVVKKFKPRDSGVVVSDGSDAGSPIKRAIVPVANFSMAPSADLNKVARDSLTPSTRAARRASAWPTGFGLTEKSGADQTALKVLFDGASGSGEQGVRPRTPVKRSNGARMFSSVPRGRATLAQPLAAKGKQFGCINILANMVIKGRKSMPSSRFDLQKLASPPSPEEVPSPTAAIAKSPAIVPTRAVSSKPRPTILVDFLRRHDSGSLASASSVESLSAQSSVDSTPTRYKVKGARFIIICYSN